MHTHSHVHAHTQTHVSNVYFLHVSKGMAFARLVEDHVYLEQHRELNTKQLIFAVRSSLALSLSTWLNLSRYSSLLGLCALLRMIELFASPPLKENSMVVVPSASLLHRSAVLFPSFFVTALPPLPSKPAWKHTSSDSILTSNSLLHTS